jgi:hypothetical protein
MSSSPCRTLAVNSRRLTILAPLPLPSCVPVKFDAAYLDRRMREHKEFQKRLAEATAGGIIDEVADGILSQMTKWPMGFSARY